MTSAAGASSPNTSASRLRPDILSVLLLLLLAIWLFRGHAFGDSLWIGNPDRLNGDLKYLRHYLHGLASGGIAAWDEHEMMGYDSLAMAGTSTNPLVYLMGFAGEAATYTGMGYVLVVLLAIASIAAYAFVRSFVPAGLAALAGAICYEFSMLTVLKSSQNSMTFAICLVIPAALLAIKLTRQETAAWCYGALALLFGALLNYMFLQEAAYALLLAGAYTAWRAWGGRSWWPLLVSGLALATAVVFAGPRIYTVGLALAEYRRAIPGLDLHDFDTLYEFQNIRPYELLRWLDGTIFGRSPSDAAALGNNINLTEGFLLYTAAAVPPLLAVGLVRHAGAWLRLPRLGERDTAFLFWTMLVCISVIAFKPVAHATFLVFLKLDFTHARILVDALLPLSVLVALALQGLVSVPEDGHVIRDAALGIAVGIATALLIEAACSQWQGTVSMAGLLKISLQAAKLRTESIVRIGLTGLAVGALVRVCLSNHANRTRFAQAALCSLVMAQCLLVQDAQVNGPLARNFDKPFVRGDFYQARRGEFAIPDEAQLRALHKRVEPESYRVALICDPNIADGFCAGHVPEFWQLRAIDGYYGPGVPRRLRALPWPGYVSLRTISFTDADKLPWDLLGLLNVRLALVAGDDLFRNIARDGERITGRADPERVRIIPSPARITPRAFFAAEVRPAASPEEAAKKLFSQAGIVDPQKTSFVEGVSASQLYAGGGEVKVTGQNDRLTLSFTPAEAARFLVLNELYYPGWRAEANGADLPILAVNAVMRGVVVPSHTNSVEFHYSSPIRSGAANAISWLGIALLGALFVLFRRWR